MMMMMIKNPTSVNILDGLKGWGGGNMTYAYLLFVLNINVYMSVADPETPFGVGPIIIG